MTLLWHCFIKVISATNFNFISSLKLKILKGGVNTCMHVCNNTPIKKLQVKCESEKVHTANSAPEVIDLKMELLIKIVNDFKLYTNFAKSPSLDVPQILGPSLTIINQMFLTNNKKSSIMVFGTVAFTTQLGFCLFQVNNRNTKNTRARCEMCVKLTIMTPEWRQWHCSGVFIVNF